MIKTGLDIAIVVPGLPFNGETLKSKALGGSETAALYMAKHLANRGEHVTVFCNLDGPPSEDGNGVRYLPIGAWNAYSQSHTHDVAIVQRAPELIAMQTTARLNVLWMHDLALTRQASLFNSALWNVDFVFVLSEFMREQYKKTYNAQDELYRVTRNGIDTSFFTSPTATKRVKRDRHHLVYAARPERGLDVLVEQIMPKLIDIDPRFRLTVCGYGNAVEHMRPFYERCTRGLKALGARGVFAGELTKRELYRLYESAGCYVYPTPSPQLQNFAEVSCITAMECQAAGLPIVTCDVGALCETIHKDAGALIPLTENRKVDVDAFCHAVTQYASEDALFDRASKAGMTRGATLDWAHVAEDWSTMFRREIQARNADNDRLIRHLHRTSDIVVAKQYMREKPDHFNELPRLQKLFAPFDFMDEEDGYRKQYERIGATHDDWVYDTAPQEPRFALLKKWLAENKKTISNVLDYGCAHGAYAIGLAQQLPHLRIHGVDIDHFSTDMATKWAEKRNVSDRATFSVWTHEMAPAVSAQQMGWEAFDAALLQEVLEHVPEPWSVIQSVERRVKKGGKVYITVPFGPWEYSSYHTYPWRCHIWHFDKHDITDMVGSKRDLVIDAYHAGDNPELGVPQGWWIISYEADHEPIGRINTKRKLWLQRPRQTVSAAMIVGGAACIETLMWALRPLYHVCDEIVIADCGAGRCDFDGGHIATQIELALAMLDTIEPHGDWYGKVRIISGVDPKKEGFENARNVALDACTMDWVLWVDHDERLMHPTQLQKYLRENVYQGYGMRQHHLSVDATMNPDMPVRLFRRRPAPDGRRLRFFGALHEHPEFAVNDGAGPIVVLTDCAIAHIGYLTESVRQQRFTRNFPLLQLDQERYPDRLLQKFFLMRDKVQIVRFELARTGGVVTDQMKALLREVVELGQKHFVGKGNYMNSDALAYYSEALAIMGEGFATSFSFEADKVEAKPNGSATYRFANKDDFMSEFHRRANEKLDPLLGEYY